MRVLYIVAAAVIAVDQLTKLIVLYLLNLKSVGAIDLVSPWLNLRMAWNRGINFGLFHGDSEATRWTLVAIAVVISAWVLVWMRRDRPGPWGMAAAGMLIGGALGNVIDRLIYGAVADFLNMSCCGIDNPYAFNVADIAIFAGALGLILFTGSGQGRGNSR